METREPMVNHPNAYSLFMHLDNELNFSLVMIYISFLCLQVPAWVQEWQWELVLQMDWDRAMAMEGNVVRLTHKKLRTLPVDFRYRPVYIRVGSLKAKIIIHKQDSTLDKTFIYQA